MKPKDPVRYHGLQTPDEIVAAIHRQWGGPAQLDPCADLSRPIAAVNWGPETNGLDRARVWRGTVWCFPSGGVAWGGPDGSRSLIGDWTHRCREAFAVNGSEVLALIPVATNTAHWRRDVWGVPAGGAATAVSFLYEPRVKFLIQGKPYGRGASIPYATVYWGRNVRAFADAWRGLGAIVEIKR